nr:Glutamine amidotransferase domain containing protein [Haemonchus contortus]
MCGIFAVCHYGCTERFDVQKARELSRRQSHRGPDFSGYYHEESTGDILCHERLAIMDLEVVQPIQGTFPTHQVIHNGEIYNHAKLRQNELKGMAMRTNCDSEVIIFLYEKIRDGSMCNMLDGVFAFALCFDGQFMAARDPIGVKQMYYGIDKLGRYFFRNPIMCFVALSLTFVDDPAIEVVELRTQLTIH